MLAGSNPEERTPYVRDIVASFHLSSHAVASLKADDRSLAKLNKKFIQWLSDKEFFESLHTKWCQDYDDQCFSLSFWLSREYLRFESQEPFLCSLENLSAPFLETFNSLVHHLPEECRFSYLLHLEGLHNEEVAFVSRQPVEKVKRDIQIAKTFLKEDLARGDFGK